MTTNNTPYYVYAERPNYARCFWECVLKCETLERAVSEMIPNGKQGFISQSPIGDLRVIAEYQHETQEDDGCILDRAYWYMLYSGEHRGERVNFLTHKLECKHRPIWINGSASFSGGYYHSPIGYTLSDKSGLSYGLTLDKSR